MYNPMKLEEYMKGRVKVPAGQESLFAHDIGMRAVTATDVVRTIRAVAKKAGQLKNRKSHDIDRQGRSSRTRDTEARKMEYKDLE